MTELPLPGDHDAPKDVEGWSLSVAAVWSMKQHVMDFLCNIAEYGDPQGKPSEGGQAVRLECVDSSATNYIRSVRGPFAPDECIHLPVNFRVEREGRLRYIVFDFPDEVEVYTFIPTTAGAPVRNPIPRKLKFKAWLAPPMDNDGVKAKRFSYLDVTGVTFVGGTRSDGYSMIDEMCIRVGIRSYNGGHFSDFGIDCSSRQDWITVRVVPADNSPEKE